MSNDQRMWILVVCLMAALLFASESATAVAVPQPFQSGLAAPNSATSNLPASSANVGMSDLVSQTFEFTGAFPAGWQSYDNVTRAPGTVYLLTYSWSTTDYTRSQGTRSATAVGPNAGSVFLPGTVYSDPVDSWMVFPVDLSPAWQAQMDFAYLKPSASGYLTVAISTDYDPISRTGTFTGEALLQATTWTTHTLPLSSYAGHKVYAAFRYQSPGGGQQSDGPFVDDLHVRANYRAILPFVSKWMLSVSKSASSDIVMPGQSLVYSITVNNADSHSAATGMTINDPLPVSTTFAGADGPFTFSNGVVTWSGLTAPAGGSLVQHLTVTVPSNLPLGTQLVNQDYAISAPPNPTVVYGPPVTSTVAGTFFDDFSNPASGWPVQNWTGGIVCGPPPGSVRSGYLPGGAGYGINVGCAWNGQVFPAPVRIADSANFTVEVDLRSNQSDLWYSSYGLFFNGSEDLRQVYIVRLFQGKNPPEWAAYYWPNFIGSSDDQPPPQMLAWDTCWTCNGADYAWNHILIRRQGSIFEVWMGPSGNLARMKVIQDSRLVDNQHVRVGFHQGNFEWRGDSGPYLYDYVFDNFRLTPATR
jgi:uncharacterized repeat protein (TIGR01451 family)